MNNHMNNNQTVDETTNDKSGSQDQKEIDLSQIVRCIENEAAELPDEAKLQLALSLKAEMKRSANSVDLHDALDYMNDNHFNPYYFDIGGGPKSILKRIVRKIIRCVAYPLNDRQNVFNEHTVKGVESLCALTEEQQLQINLLNERLQQLEKDNAALQSELNALSQQRTHKDKGEK